MPALQFRRHLDRNNVQVVRVAYDAVQRRPHSEPLGRIDLDAAAIDPGLEAACTPDELAACRDFIARDAWLRAKTADLPEGRALQATFEIAETFDERVLLCLPFSPEDSARRLATEPQGALLLGDDLVVAYEDGSSLLCPDLLPGDRAALLDAAGVALVEIEEGGDASRVTVIPVHVQPADQPSAR